MKVLLIQESIPPYRIEVFNQLAKKIDLTILQTEDFNDDTVFKVIKNPIKKIGIFNFYKNSILKIMKNYDIVICGPYISYLNILIASFFYDLKKVIYFGIGVTASYKNNFNSKPFLTKMLSLYIKKIGAAIFYSHFAKEVHKKLGVNEKKLFVANNTCQVMYNENITNEDKKHLLFIGTLYKEKGVMELLNAYLDAYNLNQNIPKLLIVGGGEMIDEITNFISKNNLDKNIELLGSIYNEELLSDVFQKSIACISPKQAGLSVLKSMGYGVAFITKKNSITGGEIFNIENNINGILYDENDLKEIILDICENKNKYLSMGIKAREHYVNNASVENMVATFVDAIEYVKGDNFENN